MKTFPIVITGMLGQRALKSIRYWGNQALPRDQNGGKEALNVKAGVLWQ
jgi:hypothetical protein